MALSPVLVAISANSPVVDGELSRYKSYRAHVWSDTDADRCGILPFAFDTENIFGAYTQYALDVPMYFIQRNDELVSTYDKTFRRFLELGHRGETATMEDWKLHLSTLFPEARLKTYMEVRAADSQSSELMLATPALLKGILYDSDCAGAAWDTVSAWPLAERMELNEQAARAGLQARAGRFELKDYACELVEIGRQGLIRQNMQNDDGQDETTFLDRMEEDVKAGRCPADRVIALWKTQWDGDVDRLIEYCAYEDA
jgi:glutamate--cysteine ligase